MTEIAVDYRNTRMTFARISFQGMLKVAPRELRIQWERTINKYHKRRSRTKKLLKNFIGSMEDVDGAQTKPEVQQTPNLVRRLATEEEELQMAAYFESMPVDRESSGSSESDEEDPGIVVMRARPEDFIRAVADACQFEDEEAIVTGDQTHGGSEEVTASLEDNQFGPECVYELLGAGDEEEMADWLVETGRSVMGSTTGADLLQTQGGKVVFFNPQPRFVRTKMPPVVGGPLYDVELIQEAMTTVLGDGNCLLRAVCKVYAEYNEGAFPAGENEEEAAAWLRTEVVGWIEEQATAGARIVTPVRGNDDEVIRYEVEEFRLRVLRALQEIFVLLGSKPAPRNPLRHSIWYQLATAVIQVYQPLCKEGFEARKQAYKFIGGSREIVASMTVLTRDWLNIYLVLMGWEGHSTDALFYTCIPHILPELWLLKYTLVEEMVKQPESDIEILEKKLVQPVVAIGSLAAKLCFLIFDDGEVTGHFNYVSPRALEVVFGISSLKRGFETDT
jgi:hypothetical protein